MVDGGNDVEMKIGVRKVSEVTCSRNLPSLTSVCIYLYIHRHLSSDGSDQERDAVTEGRRLDYGTYAEGLAEGTTNPPWVGIDVCLILTEGETTSPTQCCPC